MLSVRNVQIEAIATAMPKESYAVEDYVADYLSEKRIKRIIKETGFSRLHIAPQDKSTADYCIAAAKRLFKEFPKENIGGIVFVTQTPNFVNPATSYFIQGELSLSHDTICLDINQGCSGYVYGIYVASLLARNTQKSILLLAGETSSKYIAPDDMSMRVIMGDAGSATIVSPGGGKCI